ncbi:MAG TPA: hypothetical protein VM450_12380 [Thermomicrobiales bacterium]|nr:hypothetical protein [Thermomicrobiales bacterium]
MASRIGLNYRNEAAQTRLDGALAALAEAHGVDLPAQPAVNRDPFVTATQRLEWTADVLEELAGIGDEPSDDTPAMSEMRRADLNALAIEIGITDADKLPNRDAVIAAIESAQTPPKSGDGPDEGAA